MAKALTAFTVKNARPSKEGRRELPDGGCPGLLLVVQSSGHKSWAMRFRRPDGRSAKLTLGVFDSSGKEAESEPVIGAPLTLAAARKLAFDIQRQRARGRDVVADHATAKLRQRSEQATRGANTFGAAARDFVEQHAMKKTRRWRETARKLGLHYHRDGGDPEVIPRGLSDRWGKRPIAEIDGHDIFSLIDEVRRLGVPGLERRSEGPTAAQARAMFADLSSLFGWLQRHRRVEKNPCAGVFRPEAEKARDRVLTNAEIVKFWQAADGERYGAALKLLLLTGSRLNEVCGMRRAEISADGATWSIPGERTKNHRPHIVPLPPLARQLVESVPILGEAGFVFTATDKGPVAIGSKIKNRLDKAMKIPPWRLHDLRRTFVTHLAEFGVAPHVIELAVNHVSGTRSGIAGVYNRSELMPERKAALERWAAHVEGLVAGRSANVTPIRKKGMP